MEMNKKWNIHTFAFTPFTQTRKSFPANGVAVWNTLSYSLPSRHLADTISELEPSVLMKCMKDERWIFFSSSLNELNVWVIASMVRRKKLTMKQGQNPIKIFDLMDRSIPSVKQSVLLEEMQWKIGPSKKEGVYSEIDKN